MTRVNVPTNYYTTVEDRIIEEGFHEGHTDREIAARLSSEGPYPRSAGAVERRRQLLKLKRGQQRGEPIFTPAEDRLLRDAVLDGMSSPEIAELLTAKGHPPRTCNAIRSRRHRLELFQKNWETIEDERGNIVAQDTAFIESMTRAIESGLEKMPAPDLTHLKPFRPVYFPPQHKCSMTGSSSANCAISGGE